MKTVKLITTVGLVMLMVVWANLTLAAGSYPVPKEDQFATYKLDLNGDGTPETITTFRRAVGWFEQNGKRASNFEVAIRITQPTEEGKPARITIYQTSFTKIHNNDLGEGGIYSARLIHPYYPDFNDLSQGPYPTFAWEINGRKGLCVGVQITGGYVRDIENEIFDQKWTYIPLFFTFTDGAYKLQYAHPNDQAVIEKFRNYAIERFNNRIPLELVHKNPPATQIVMVNKDKAKTTTTTTTTTNQQSKVEKSTKDNKAKKVSDKEKAKPEVKPKETKKEEAKKPSDVKPEQKKPADKKPETPPTDKDKKEQDKAKEPPKQEDKPKEPEKPAPNPDENKEPANKTEQTEGK